MLRKADLGPLDLIASRGSGSVYAIVGTDWVYKELHVAVHAHGGLDWAVASVAFWDSLSAADRAHLAGVSVWPTHVVEDNGQVVGILMPRIPADFCHTRVDAHGATTTVDSAFKWLTQSRANLAGRHLDVDQILDVAVKLRLLAQYVEEIAWLHARGVVFGDISFSNVDFALSPPRILILDADSACTGPTNNQAPYRNTLGFQPPEHSPVETVVTPETDVYKLGVLILGVLTPGSGSTGRPREQVSLLQGRVPQRLITLVSAAYDDDPRARPAAAELARCLRDIANRLSQPPLANLLELDREVMRRGETVGIRWDFDDATLITVELPGGRTIDHGHAAGPHGCVFKAAESGLIAVHATNRNGTSSFALGPIAVYDPLQVTLKLPPFDVPVDDIARRALAGLPSLPQAQLPRKSPLELPVLVVPPLPLPDVAGLTAVSRSIDAAAVSLGDRLRRLRP